MSNSFIIQILPEAQDFLEYLAKDLIIGGYKNDFYHASKNG